MGFVGVVYGFGQLQFALLAQQPVVIPLCILFGATLLVVVADIRRRYLSASSDNPSKREIEALLLKEQSEQKKH